MHLSKKNNIFNKKSLKRKIKPVFRANITKKIPPKQLKHPALIFKNSSQRRVIKRIYDYFYDEAGKGVLQLKFISRKKVIIDSINYIATHHLKINPKNIDKHLHFIFPLTSMGAVGYFYKGFLEQLYPKARFTFLVTPSARKFESSTIEQKIENLKKHLSKSLNENDRCLIMIDFVSQKRTQKLMSFALEELYKSKSKIDFHDLEVEKEKHNVIYSFKYKKSDRVFFTVHSPEINPIKNPSKINLNKTNLNYYKEKDTLGTRVVSKHENVQNQKDIKRIKDLEKVIKYTFYYI